MRSLLSRSNKKDDKQKKAIAVNEFGASLTPEKHGLKRSFSDSITPIGFNEELQLRYGYIQDKPEHDLSALQVEDVIRSCAFEIRARCLMTPLLFSSRALNISADAVSHLIRAYLSSRESFKRNLSFANPHSLCAMIKWALCRHVNTQGSKGVLAFSVYERWRMAEKESKYPARHITTHLINLLPSSTAQLLTTLFSLLSSCLAYTSSNGTTPRKLAGLFSSYIFGLPADQTFESTYSLYIKFTNATEHLLLAYVRDPKDAAIKNLPTKLGHFVKNYPKGIAANLNSTSRSDIRLVQLTRIARLVRFYSQDLIQSASTWDVPHSKNWNALYPLQKNSSLTNSMNQPTYSSFYKHLLNISSEQESEDDRFQSLIEKDWHNFSSAGFQDSLAPKLAFDLSESERLIRKQKRSTLEWSAFAQSGFGDRQTYLEEDLSFNPNLARSVAAFPEQKKQITNKLKKVEKALPDFPYDITPHEEQSVAVDELFFEVYADVLVASGWTKEEIKESSWAIIQYKSLPPAGTASLRVADDARSDDKWFLIEEVVPAEYRQDLLDGKGKKSKRMSFLRSVRKRNKKEDLSPSFHKFSNSAPSSAMRMPSPIDESVFQAGVGSTKKMSLAPSQTTPDVTPLPSRSTSLNRSTPAPYEHYRPALQSMAEEGVVQSPMPRSRTAGVGNAMTSQPAEHFPHSQSQQPLRSVYDESPDKSRRASVDSGFFARVASLTRGRRHRANSETEQEFKFATRSFNEDTAGTNQNRTEEMTGHERKPSREDAWVDILLRSEERSKNQEYDPSIRSSRSQTSLIDRPSIQLQRSDTMDSNRPLPPRPSFDAVSRDDHQASSTHATEAHHDDEEEEIEPLPKDRSPSRLDYHQDVVWRGSMVERHSALPSPRSDHSKHRDSLPPPPASPTDTQIAEPATPIKEDSLPEAIPRPPKKDLPAQNSPPMSNSAMSERVAKLVAQYTSRSESHIPTRHGLPPGAVKPQTSVST